MTHQKQHSFGAMYEGIYLLGGARTPFGKFCGTLGAISPTDLGIIASRAALERTGVPANDIEHVIFANIIQSGFDAIYLPRHVGLYTGIPQCVPAQMVQRICGSGFETIITAAEQITLRKCSVALAGGAENMTLTPTVAFGNRTGYRFGQPRFGDMLWEGLSDPSVPTTMGGTAEVLAKKYDITREAVDEFALRSHLLASTKSKEGRFESEIVPVASGVHECNGLQPRTFRATPTKAVLSQDENVRPTSIEELSKLKPSFSPTGVQTPGNSSGIVDGGAAVVVANKLYVSEKEKTPLARLVASASAGVDPRIMGIGPAPAIRAVLELTGLSLSNIGLFEINEAFGAQIIAVERELGLEREKLNVNGGAIALGHPLGATGIRLTHTLALEMQKRGIRFGIASACIGGGQGTAILLENIPAEKVS